jgi:NarL family two-component system response regulator LiaR
MESGGDMQQPWKQPVRVLIADDCDTTRLGLRTLLSLDPGIEVIGEAANGREAVQAAGKAQPDVVLIDGRMPVMDGLEATRLIKSRWPHIRVIMLTSCPTYQAGAVAAGADACFLKDGHSIDVLCDAILEHSCCQ